MQKQKPLERSFVTEAAAKHELTIRGGESTFQITDSMCSCRFIQSNGKAIRPIVFVMDILRLEMVKNMKIGWTWASGTDIEMKTDTPIVRLTLNEFMTMNQDQTLSPDVWYRLHDPTKYEFGSNEM